MQRAEECGVLAAFGEAVSAQSPQRQVLGRVHLRDRGRQSAVRIERRLAVPLQHPELVAGREDHEVQHGVREHLGAARVEELLTGFGLLQEALGYLVRGGDG